MFDEVPSFATQPIVPAVIAPADPPHTAIRFGSMPDRQMIHQIIPQDACLDNHVPYWGECSFNHRTAALVSSTASRIAITASSILCLNIQRLKNYIGVCIRRQILVLTCQFGQKRVGCQSVIDADSDKAVSDVEYRCDKKVSARRLLALECDTNQSYIKL